MSWINPFPSRVINRTISFCNALELHECACCMLSFLYFHWLFPPSARETSPGNRSIYKSTRERVDSKGLYGTCRLRLMGSWQSTIQGVIGRVISKSAEREARGRFEITRTITPWIVRHEVQLLINRNYNKIREEYDSGIDYLTGRYIQLLKLDAEKEPKCNYRELDYAYCPITQAWRVQLYNYKRMYNYDWNQACWWPIRFENFDIVMIMAITCLLYTSPSPRDA